MKPIFLKKNTKSSLSSFFVLKTEVPHIYDKWHFHQELELFHVIRGQGTRFIGDSVQEFGDGDLVLVGANLPHVWKSSPEYYQDQNLKASVILVHFLGDIFGESFLNLPENDGIKRLISEAGRGIKISSETKVRTLPILEKMVSAEGAQRMILLLSILNEIAVGSYELLASNWFRNTYTDAKNVRAHSIYDYVMANFQEKITLDELAEVAHMNKTALCRYFKATTKKTITEFINEVRIGYAFNLLTTRDFSISQACFESGFNNLSYFNRQFQKIMGCNPSSLKKSI